MTGGSGSTSVTGFSGPGPAAGGATIDDPIDGPVDERIDEHCRRAPAEPLRPYVAWYTGYLSAG